MKTGQTTKIMAALRSPAAQESVTAALRTVNSVDLEVFTGRLHDLMPRLSNSHAPDLLLVEIDWDDGTEISALESFIRTNSGKTSVLATSADATVEEVRRLLRIGVTDFIPQPISREDVLDALQTAAERPRLAQDERAHKGSVISFLGCRGGLGTTTLAVQTACGLVSQRKLKPQVCLLDLDLQFGNGALYLDLDPRNSVLDFVGSVERIDGALLRGTLSHHKSGLEVLGAPGEYESLDALPSEVVAKVIEVAANEFDHVVIDLPHAWTPWMTEVVAASDLIALVTQLSVAAVRQGRRQLEALQQQNISETPIVVVVNRWQKPGLFSRTVKVKEAEKGLKHPIDYFIPNDFQTVSAALNEGVPIAEIRRGAKVTRRMRKFVDFCLEKVPAQEGRSDPVLRK